MNNADSTLLGRLTLHSLREAARVHPLLAALDEVGREQVLRTGRWADYRPKRIISRLGESVDSVSFLIAGSVKICLPTSKGQAPALALLSAPNVLGANEALTGESGDLVRTLSQAAVIQVGSDVFRWMVEHQPRFAFEFCKLQARNASLSARTQGSFRFEGLRVRVARLLLSYAATIGQTTGNAIVLTEAISQDAMAKDLGVSRKSLNQVLGSFKSAGVVAKRQARYWILNEQALAAFD